MSVPEASWGTERVRVPPALRRQDSGTRRAERLRTEIESAEDIIKRLRRDVVTCAQRVVSLSDEIRRRLSHAAESDQLRPAAGALSRWTLSVRIVRDAAQQAAQESLCAVVSSLEERAAAAPEATMADLRRALACTKHAAEFDHVGVDSRFQSILLACTLEDQRDAARRLLTAHENILSSRAAAGSARSSGAASAHGGGDSAAGSSGTARGGAWAGVSSADLAAMALDLVDELHALRQRWESTRGALDGVRDSGELDMLPSPVEQDELRATVGRLVARLHTVTIQCTRRAPSASPAASPAVSPASGAASRSAAATAAASASTRDAPAVGGAGAGTAGAAADEEEDPSAAEPDNSRSGAHAGAVPSAPATSAAPQSLSSQLTRLINGALDQALQLTHTARTLRADHSALMERLDLLADMEELAACPAADRASLIASIEAVRSLLNNIRWPTASSSA